MIENATTLIDVYEAGGAAVSEDRKSVTLKPNDMHAFDIVLRVYPIAVEHDGITKEKVTFGVILDDEYVLGKHIPYQGTPMHMIVHDAEIVLPVDQIRILKEDK